MARQGRPVATEDGLRIVGIGASAGGLEAIEAFFSAIPERTGLAYVVVQHLSPDHKSLMVELLSKRTPMVVFRAEEGMTFEPDKVYLIPPGKNLSIFHGRAVLRDQPQHHGPNLPIDIFLRSLAEDRGERSAAVILSGTGSDGARGVKAVKEAGGMVLVQSVETARFDGMPRASIATGLADCVGAPEDLAKGMLSMLALAPALPPVGGGEDEAEATGLDRLFALLRERVNVDFTHYKPSTVRRRIERRMQINRMADLDEYVRHLESSATEAELLTRELFIGVTSFFRDPPVFEHLGEKVLPELFERAGGRELRIWSVGCSSGEEAYSLAMLCREHMRRIGRPLPVKIFATDVDRKAVTRAGQGSYAESLTADLPPDLLARYFVRRGEGYQVCRPIREMVVFAQHDVIKDPPFTRQDLISCRNLLIYLQPILQRKVLSHFHYCLNESGVLLLGGSETTGELADLFSVEEARLKIYRARGSAVRPIDGERLVSGFDPRPTPFGASRDRGGRREDRLLSRLLVALGDRWLPPGVVVDEEGRLLFSVGDVTPFFRIPPGHTAFDVERMAVDGLRIPLSTGLAKVLKDEGRIRYENIRLEDPSRGTVHLVIESLPRRKGQERLVAIFVESPKAAEPDGTAEAIRVFDLDGETRQRIETLEQELQFNRENLQATIEELETSNEELQATNEELLASNEELQSTNEELQSVNEELYTVNAEYQTKIVELTEMTNDMDNLLVATDVGTLFLDEHLEIRRFTPQVQRYLHVLDGDVGRPFVHLRHEFPGVNLVESVEAVRREGRVHELELAGPEGDWCLLRILPYRVSEDLVAGVVLTFLPIDSIKKGRDALRRAVDLHEALNQWIRRVLEADERGGEVEPMRLDELCGMLLSVAGYSRAWIGAFQVDGAGRPQLRPLAASGCDEVFLRRWSEAFAQDEGGPCARVFAENQVVRVDGDGRGAERERIAPSSREAKEGALYLPVLGRQGPVGVLAVYDEQARIHDDAEVAMMQEVADTLAAVMRRLPGGGEGHR